MRLLWVLLVAGIAMLPAQDSRFEPAENCALCHSRIRDVGQYTLWSQSMMAHASRDPYWKAKVASEAAIVPGIGDKCVRCHVPAQHAEGVTCTVCHQITPGNLGTAASFSGGFHIGGTREIYGPHDNPFSMPMEHHTQYTPVLGKHMLDAALCATCHTLITHAEPGRDFVEQAPFLEWLASDYAKEGRACQSCHVPQLAEPEYIAHRPPGGPFPPTRPRKPFGQHSFVGANVRGLEKLGQTEQAARSLAFLHTALELKLSATRVKGTVEARVEVVNHAGHKLPTAYPSRRLWLHLRATDESGHVIFESGAPDHVGDQPHRREITSPDQAMVWEVEYSDVKGRPTTSLVRAATYRKDNRILPRGFRSQRQVAPVGVERDADFLPGSDAVLYRFKAAGRCNVTVTAFYQSIKPSWAMNSNKSAPVQVAAATKYSD